MSGQVPSSLRASFGRTYPYSLDRFQLEAMDLLDAGRSVLVTAPTGSGKTVVAEYAVHLALGEGVRAFYTTPLKALSNQKYGDLVARHGSARVGLLTGDNSINAGAPVVVMTTEILRNMIHSERTSLSRLGYVVLDEVHFLEDPYRGGVWEEVILGAPPEVKLVCLSATVANADDLAAWIGQVRGSTGIVREDRRPVALHDLFAIGDRSAHRIHLLPVFVHGRPNSQAIELDELLARHGSRTVRPRPRIHQTGGRSRTYRPRRAEVVERLHEADLLPAIYFVFSRAGCDEAVRYCLDDGLRLTSPPERQRIREIAEAHVDALSDDDLAVLGYGRFVSALESGMAAHHAGMVPPFRETVEACFAEALVKVVFATETLALGINMPARSVVIEELTKYGGAGHQELTPGEYTQLTGRAGRRGIDEVGYAVVLASPFHSFDDVARLAGAPGRALTSSFRPTYNLAISLVRRFDRTEAYRIVTSSFAQWLSEEDLAGQLTSVLDMLEARGYLRGWSVTPDGEVLAGLYHEADLLISESLRAGLLDGLEPAALAAAVSAFCFEARRERDGALDPPQGLVSERLLAVAALSEDLTEDERSRSLPLTRGIDAGFAALARDWARGRDLRRVLAPPNQRGSERRTLRPVMTGGDFVRNMKQVIDLLRQVATVAPLPETRSAAHRAAGRLLRGVVSASAQVSIASEGSLAASATTVESREDSAATGEVATIHAPDRNAS
ncbi:MAG: DEAD/DEAH box helicase [Acidimicrobiales bacterium]